MQDWKAQQDFGEGIFWELLKLGVPMGLQNIITAAGGFVVQAVVNGFGIWFITGYVAANKLYVLLEIAASSYAQGMLAYIAQNRGAGNQGRIKAGLKVALVDGVVTSLVMSLFSLLYCLYIIRAYIQGLGNTIAPMASSFVQLVMRVGCALVLTKLIGNTGIFWGEVMAWLGTDIFLVPFLADNQERQY